MTKKTRAAVAIGDGGDDEHLVRPVSDDTTSLWIEAKQMMNLAIPTMIVSVGSIVPPAMSASYVGRHLGTLYLAALALGTLTANLLTLSVLQGLYSASDTLSPQAFGAKNYREVGLIAMRGFAAGMAIVIPINILLCFFMDDILIFVGEEEEASRLAAQWYRVYTLTVPFYALYTVTWKFLSTQEIMMPLVLATLCSVFVILPTSLHILVPTMGLQGSALAILIYQVSQAGLVLLYLVWKKPHHPETWPDLSCWREALLWKPFVQYIRLGTGGIMASSEWIWWEMLTLMIGTLGVVPLSVHAIPTQVILTCFMLPYGIGIALSIRIGAILPTDFRRAKRLTLWSVLVSSVVFAVFSIAMYVMRERICSWFTTDPEVLAGAKEIWWKIAFSFFQSSYFGIFTGISYGLGMQWTQGWATVVFMWLFSLPAIYIHGIVFNGGLSAVWTWIYPPYIGINTIMAYKFIVADWEAISRSIRTREGINESDEADEIPSEATTLL